jgi:hypothetical protein
MDNVETYLYGQGRVSLALRDAITGALGRFVYVGDVSALSAKLTTEKAKHVESNSGQKGTVRSFGIGKSCTLDMTWHQFDTDNLAIVLQGTSVATAAGTVTAEEIAGPLAVGDVFYLQNPGVSNVIIKDSTGTPIVLVLDTDYSIEDAAFGRCRLLNVGTFAWPLLVDYSYSARKAAGMFTTGQKEYALRYEGVNLAEGNAPVMADYYKVAPDVLAELALITSGSDVAGMQITGEVLRDTSKPATGALGQYGHITQIAAAA